MPTEELNLALMADEFSRSSSFTSLASSTQEFYQSALKTMLDMYKQCEPAPQAPIEFLEKTSAVLVDRNIHSAGDDRGHPISSLSNTIFKNKKELKFLFSTAC